MFAWLTGGGNDGLQSSGVLSKAQLLEYFAKGRALFADADFKAHLRAVAAGGGSVEDAITSRQKEILKGLGISGDWGISFMGQVAQVYGQDGVVMAAFYTFVYLEERTCDEVEMSPEEFKDRHAAQDALLARMDLERERMAGMSPAEAQRYAQSLYTELLGGAPACCNDAECRGCEKGGQGQSTAGHQHCDHDKGHCHSHGHSHSHEKQHGSSAMSQAEQFAFFQSMQKQ